MAPGEAGSNAKGATVSCLSSRYGGSWNVRVDISGTSAIDDPFALAGRTDDLGVHSGVVLDVGVISSTDVLEQVVPVGQLGGLPLRSATALAHSTE